MQLEVVAELFAYLLVAALMTGLGLFAEAQSLVRLSAGETTVALWFGGVGVLLLYAGVYLLGYEKVVKNVREMQV